MADLFTTRSLVHAVAGAAAGCTAISIFFPINTVRTRHQLSQSKQNTKGVLASLKEIVDQEGFTSLYGGLWANIVCLGTSNFVYFYLYNGLRAAMLSQKRRSGEAQSISAGLNLLISAIAGSFNVLLTNPLWVACMRISTQRKQKQAKPAEDGPAPFTGVYDALTRIGRTESIPALWNGAGASMLLVSNPVFQFVVYEKVKKLMERVATKRGAGIHSVEFFLMAALAKAVATVLTYPVQLAQVRLRNVAKQVDAAQYTGTADCIMQTLKADGFIGLFRGMEAKMWQTVLSSAFHFLFYEKIIEFIQNTLL